MTRVAAVDCGTNSIRLLVADVDEGAGKLVDLDRRMEIVRLGQGVDRTGRLAPEALERTFVALRTYAEAIERLGAERVRMVATSATRDAANRADFVDGVVAILGVEPDVATGDEEAALSFAGATRELSGGDVAGALPRRRHRRRFHRVRPRRRDGRGGPLGRRRLRPAHRATPARRPADRRAGGSRAVGHRRGDRPRGHHRAVGAGGEPGRAGRVGHHGGRDRARPGRLRPRADPPRADQCGRGARGDRAPAGDDAARTAPRCRSCIRVGSTSSAAARSCWRP